MSIKKEIKKNAPESAKRKKHLSRNILILAIETSCDETAISIVKHDKKKFPTVLSSKISSQVKLHSKWGGVVPNLAARQHVRNISHLLHEAFRETNVVPSDIDIISVTAGPGLIPALLIGCNYAKTLAYRWEKPLLGIHHIEGHIYANFISNKISVSSNNQKTNPKQNSNIEKDTPSKISNSLNIKFPILCLVVSGGHTQLVLMKDHLQYEVIGQTVDDAVGEAFDKVARILGIGYPGGPAVARHAANFKFPCLPDRQAGQAGNFQTNSNKQIPNESKNTAYKIQNTRYKIQFPRPMLSKQNFNFSFSGLKTAVLYEVKKFVAADGSSTPTKGVELPKEYVVQVCHEFQQACIDVLIAKTIKAAEKYQPKTILLAGGVSANIELRNQLGEAISKNLTKVSYLIPDLNLTGDNAAMIGVAASFRWEKMTDAQKKATLKNWKKLQPDANLKMQ